MAREDTASNGATFQLDRFEWAAPDRLEIAGSFAGIEPPRMAPTLVVGAADGTRRLTATPVDSPVDGEQWTAAFLWQEPPVPFEQVELELGDGLSVVLPAPGSGDAALAIRGAPRPPAETLRSQAALLAAQEEAREASAAHGQVLQELARVREDLEAERSAHAADAERFKQGLAQVRDAGEAALAATEGELAGLRERVRELERESGDVAALRSRLAAAEGGLEQARAETAEVHTALDRAREEIRETTGALERARAEAAETERLRGRLDAVRHALEDGAGRCCGGWRRAAAAGRTAGGRSCRSAFFAPGGRPGHGSPPMG